MAKPRRRTVLRGVRITGRDRCKLTADTWRIDDVKTCASICGSHWFSKDTMRFFKSRVAGRVYPDGRGGGFFVSSERGPYGPRAYSVRYYDPVRCNFDTIGEFMGHRTAATARRAAQAAARRGRRK